MASLISPRHKSRPRIEIIPFIDIMFFLLATFMMVSMTMVQNEGIDLQLPVASKATPIADSKEPLTISVAKDGSLYLDKTPVSKKQLSDRMAELQKTAPATKIILQGDYGCEFGKIVEVFDEAGSYGLTKLVIRTQRPPEKDISGGP